MTGWTRRDFMRRGAATVGSAAVGLSLADLLAACGAPGSEQSSGGGAGLPGTVKIGMNTELTGAGAQTGQLARAAADLAVAEINGKGGIGGKAKIDLLVQDAASSDQGAVTAFRKNVDQDQVDVLLGPVKSTQILAMIDQVKEAKIPTLVGGTNATLTHRGNEWLFRMRPDDSIAAQAMVKYVKEELKLTKVAILHDSDAFGTGGADLVDKGARDSGLTVSRKEKYSTGDNDYTPQLLNIKNSAPDIMVLYGTNASDDGKIIKQFRQLGLGFKIMGSPSVAQNITINLAAEALNGVYVTVDYVPETSEVSKSYAAAYKKKHNQPPDDLSAWAYDSLYIFARAIANANTVDKAKVRTALAAIKNEKRVVGTVTFDRFGNGLHSVSVVSMQGGQKQLRKVVSVPIPQ